MFKIERNQICKETTYSIGGREFVVKDLVRGKCKRLAGILKTEIEAMLESFRGEDLGPYEYLEIIYDKAGEVIAMCLNVAIGLQGDEKIDAQLVNDNLSNSDMLAFAEQFSEDNMLSPVVNLFKDMLSPFFSTLKEFVSGMIQNNFIQGIVSMTKSEGQQDKTTC